MFKLCTLHEVMLYADNTVVMIASISGGVFVIEAGWQIGQIILAQRKTQKWGSKIIKQLAQDLKKEFNTMKGLSSRNLEFMKQQTSYIYIYRTIHLKLY